MAAKGKINASNVNETHRIIVKVLPDGTVRESATKTGEGVRVARVLSKTFRAAQGPYEARGKYVIETTSGSFEAAAIQTMWLAPEDPAGIKRAYAEAVDEENERNIVKANEELEPVAEEITEAEKAGLIDAPAASRLREIHAAAGRCTRMSFGQRAMGGLALVHLNRIRVELAHAEALTLNSQAGKVGRDSENDGGEADMNDTETAAWAGEPGMIAYTQLPDPDGSNTQYIETLGADNDAHLPVAGVEGTSLGEMREAFKDEDETPEAVRELTGSSVVKLLERVHERIRQNHPEVPEVVIVTGAGIGMGSNKWGHFRPQGWTTRTEDGQSGHIHEMFMAGETLAKGSRQVLQIMIHESAHALAEHRGEKDTSRQGRWHNAVFLKTAKELGLEYKGGKADKTLGFSAVTLKDETIEEYRDLLDELDAEIHLMVSLPRWLGGSDEDQDGNGGENMGKAPKGTETKSTSNVKLTCECEEPNIIRASKKVADKMVVNCGDCDALFLER